jgi:hypothetical protein
MTVRIQIIKVYDIDVPEDCEDPVAYAHGLQTTEIQDTGRLIDTMTDNAELFPQENRFLPIENRDKISP